MSLTLLTPSPQRKVDPWAYFLPYCPQMVPYLLSNKIQGKHWIMMLLRLFDQWLITQYVCKQHITTVPSIKGSLYISGKPPTYPSPKPTFWEESVSVDFNRGGVDEQFRRNISLSWSTVHIPGSQWTQQTFQDSPAWMIKQIHCKPLCQYHVLQQIHHSCRNCFWYPKQFLSSHWWSCLMSL